MTDKGSPLVINHAAARLHLLHSATRRWWKPLWPFILLFHLLSAIFTIALVVLIHNTAASDSNNNSSSNMDLILAKFPFPPPTTTSSYPFHSVNLHDIHASNLSKRWGHFDRLPATPKCYRQERTACYDPIKDPLCKLDQIEPTGPIR